MTIKFGETASGPNKGELFKCIKRYTIFKNKCLNMIHYF